ncbi:MAG: biotin/lipoyl-binding protein, partial [Planctomycetota bacterium]
MKSYIILFSLFILSVLTFQSCSDTKASSPDSNPSTPPRTVKVMPAQSIKYREAVKASGQLALAEEARLSFKTGGVIRKIHVREGQQVRAGQLLAEIETDEISARAQQAELGKAQGAIS